MKFKQIAILLLALYGKSSNALDHDNWKCTHDQEDHPEPELLQVDEDYNPEGNDHEGRTLASYSNLRTYGYYGAISSSSSFKSYVSNDLMPPIMSYFKAALKVKYPVSGNMKVSTSSICGITTPSVLKSGIAADYVHIVKTDSSSSYIASTTTCSLASGSKRPLIGRTTISTYYMKATTDPIVHEKNMMCVLHEVVHAMGFSKSLYSHFLNSNGKTLTGHVLTGSLAGVSTTILNLAPLTSKLRTYFGCSTLKGAYMENTGSSGTAGCHFERRQFGFEVMTSGLISQMQVSEFTLALLEGTGWYVPNYDYADPFFFGQGEGCSFLTGSCSASAHPDEWCSSSARACTNTGRGGGSCSADGRSDGCKFIHPNDNYDCGNTNAAKYARLPTLQTFGRGKQSKCFEGTLNSGKAGAQTTFCFVPTCSGSGSSTKLTLNVGGKSVVCSKAGTVSVSGYAGSITCPDPQAFCKTAGEKICPRNCMGRGTCVSGVCKCNSGFKGEDCAMRS